jgi:probable HAF family extracellular repeat protein
VKKLLLFLLLTAPTRASGGYVVTDLGAVHPSDRVQAHAINDAGQVVGESGVTSFLWEHGNLHDLGTLPNTMPVDPMVCRALAINAGGTVVGGSGGYGPVVMSGFQQSAPVELVDGHWVDLGKGNKNVGSEAVGINDRGDVVGTDQHRGFLLAHGKWRELEPVSHIPAGNDCSATGINDAGLVVGFTTVAGTTRQHPVVHGCMWVQGRVHDLGVLTGEHESSAQAVSAVGMIVGSSGAQAVLWSGGRPHALGALPGYTNTVAYAINRSGTVVGTASTDHLTRAWVWRSGRMVDLNSWLPADSGWILETAEGINSQGRIVGSGQLNGQQRAYLLAPL